MSNTSKVRITVKSDVNPEQVFSLLKEIGVRDSALDGNIITGTVVNNLISPLRTVEGVESVSVDGGDPVTEIPKELPKLNPAVPSLTPLPQPAPSTVDNPSPTKWSALSKLESLDE